MMKRWIWLPWLIGFFFVVHRQRISATDFMPTSKEELNFEVNSIVFSETTATISGWALITDAQHYRTSSDHHVWIELLSLTHQLVIPAQITDLSMTSISLQVGLPECADNVYFSITCNYDYDMVGFRAEIDMSNLKKGEEYITNLLFSALNANVHRKTPMYYPIKAPVTRMIGDYLFSAISSLDDTTLRISATPVYARKEPSKTSAIWAYGSNCSSSYTNRLYFKYGAFFSNIFNRFPIDNQTYYAMGAKLDVCVDGRRRITEGVQFTPVWISSLFIEYTGTPLTIRSELINTAPTITATDQSVMVGEIVNLKHFASANDLEEGDLSDQITVTSDYQDRAGIYHVTYQVMDKYGYEATKTIRITVIEPENTPPYISAFNRSVLQFTHFDPLTDVSAFDLEEGNLTSRIIVTGTVDTRYLGESIICYAVTDSKGLSHERCIEVTVYSLMTTMTRFRLLSNTKPFYAESIPPIWIHKFSLIQTYLSRSVPIHSLQIIKKPQ
jgi:ribosomal protein S26